MSEPTRYTKCWHCDTRFPLREIRAHAEKCRTRGRGRVSFPRIENPEAKPWTLEDKFSMELDLSDLQAQLTAALREAENRLEEAVVANWLRARGYSVEKLGSPRSVFCPNCQARPGQPCSTPTDTGRSDVRSDWFHYARRDAANA